MPNIEFNNISIKAKVVSDTPVIKSNVTTTPTATTKDKGLIRIATDEEVLAGELNDTAVTPYTLKKATFYEHEQGAASDTWTIIHNLNKKPAITVVDSADNVIEGAERYIDNNTVEIRFNGAFKGKAYLS